MTSVTYTGAKHTFTSRSSNDVVQLASGKNEQLYIEDLRTQSVFYSDFSDNLGLNQLGTSQVLQHTNVNLGKQGTSVAITDVSTDAYLAVGGPIDATNGGVGTFKSTGGASFLEGDYLTPSQATSNGLQGFYSDINEDGDLIVYSNYAQNSSTIQSYRRSGSSWSASNVISGGISCKVNSDATTDYVIGGLRGNKVEIRTSTGGAWSLQQQLVDDGGALSEFYAPVDIYNTDTCCYSTGTVVSVWTRTGTTWTKLQDISQASITGLSLYGTVLAMCTTGELHVYQRASESVLTDQFQLINSFDITGITDTCTNGTYVFCSNASAIRIYQKIGSNWVRSTNNTADTGSSRISCSQNWLAVGKPTNDSNAGEVYVYPISAYTNSLITTNNIQLDSTNLALTSTYGSITFSPAISTSTGLFSDGSLTSPSISFTNKDTLGLYRSGLNTLGIVSNGVESVEIDDTQIRTLDGTTSNPSYSFVSDPDTGMVLSSAGNVSFISGGSNVATINGEYANFLATTGSNGYFIQRGNGAQSIANLTNVTLNASYWTGSQISIGDTVSDRPSYSAGVVTINKAGRYYVNYSIVFSPNATGIRSAWILFNSTTLYAYQALQTSSLGNSGLNGSVVLNLNATNTLEVVVRQSSGGALAMDTGVAGEFQVYRLN